MFKAQYDVLRANGHSPSEAFNETCEEALQSLYPLVAENGMDYMFKACSTTARRGALDAAPVFEKALKPVFEDLYARVRDGSETRRTIEFASQKNYRELFQKETDEVAAQGELRELREELDWLLTHPHSLCRDVARRTKGQSSSPRPCCQGPLRGSLHSSTVHVA